MGSISSSSKTCLKCPPIKVEVVDCFVGWTVIQVLFNNDAKARAVVWINTEIDTSMLFEEHSITDECRYVYLLQYTRLILCEIWITTKSLIATIVAVKSTVLSTNVCTDWSKTSKCIFSRILLHFRGAHMMLGYVLGWECHSEERHLQPFNRQHPSVCSRSRSDPGCCWENRGVPFWSTLFIVNVIQDVHHRIPDAVLHQIGHSHLRASFHHML